MTTFTVSVYNLKQLVTLYINQIEDHREKACENILDQYIGKTFTVGHLWWKKYIKIETYHDAVEYIEKYDPDQYSEYIWAQNSCYNLFDLLKSLDSALNTKIDLISVDLSIDDMDRISRWEKFYLETYCENNG